MRTERFALSWLCALGAALCFLTACPGKLHDKEGFLLYAATHDAATHDATVHDDGGDTVPGNVAVDASLCGDVVTRIFVVQCGDGGCHGALSPQQGLDLVSPGVASRVVGVAAKGCVATLADPKNPQNSLLYQKLAPKPPCGSQMPLARTPLSTADASCLLNWIAAQ
jgi:hypothetical protein